MSKKTVGSEFVSKWERVHHQARNSIEGAYAVTDGVRTFYATTPEDSDFMLSAARVYERHLGVGRSRAAVFPSGNWRIEPGAEDRAKANLADAWKVGDQAHSFYTWSEQDAHWLLRAAVYYSVYREVAWPHAMSTVWDESGLSVRERNICLVAIQRLAGEDPLREAAALRMLSETVQAITRGDIHEGQRNPPGEAGAVDRSKIWADLGLGAREKNAFEEIVAHHAGDDSLRQAGITRMLAETIGAVARGDIPDYTKTLTDTAGTQATPARSDRATKMEYQILEAADPDVLVGRVTNAIAEGWVPLGGVAVNVVHRVWENTRKGYDESETDWTYTQAMTRGAGA